MSAVAGAAPDRWHKRPGLARAYRIYVLSGPLLTLVAVTFFGTQLVPAGTNAMTNVLRWTLIAGIALASAVLAERTLSRLLPVAALLDLQIGFPGAVPTRSRIASLASLRGGDAELIDLLPGMADRDLDAAAEHVMIRYASEMRNGLRLRAHLDRVRCVADLIAERLHLPAADRDRLQWALLLRTLGSLGDDEAHPHHPLIAWLGPWAALLHGPFIDVASAARVPAVRRAAHVAAVADAYVVVSAAHPYQRPTRMVHPGVQTQLLASHHLLPEAVEALISLPERRRRQAAGSTAGVSSLVARYAPTPQPMFALASVVAALVLVVGAGLGPAEEAELPRQTTALDSQAVSTPMPDEQVGDQAAGDSPTARAAGAEGSDAGPATTNRTSGARQRSGPVSTPAVAFEEPYATTGYAYASGPTATGGASGSGTATSGTATSGSGGSDGSGGAGGTNPPSGSDPKPDPTPDSKPEPEPEPEPSPKPSSTPTPPPPDPTPDPTPTTGPGDGSTGPVGGATDHLDGATDLVGGAD